MYAKIQIFFISNESLLNLDVPKYIMLFFFSYRKYLKINIFYFRYFNEIFAFLMMLYNTQDVEYIKINLFLLIYSKIHIFYEK